MTTAVCLKCGGLKRGSLTPCSECGYSPETDKERAKSTILSDHHFSMDELQVFAEKIREGESVDYPQHLMKLYVQTFEEIPDIERGVKRSMLILFLLGIGLVLLFVWGLARLL